VNCRALLAAVLPALCAHGEDAAQLNPEPVPDASAVFIAPKAAVSVVAFARDPAAMAGYAEDAATSRALVDAVVKSITGQATVARAWREILGPVKPEDRIGIKVNASCGRWFSTRPGVVSAIVAGLEEAGSPRKQIVVWDKNAADLRDAGLTAERLGCDVRSVEPPKGWDREASLQAPTLGRLIWGDLLFNERAAGPDKTESDQLSSRSHLPLILTRDVAKFINVATLADDAGCGVAGAIRNATVGNLDNWRRFTNSRDGAAGALPELYADARIRGKCVLHVVDGLIAQFAGGPNAAPGYAFAHGTIYGSRDPIALDATLLRLMEKWRADAGLPPIGPRAAWLESAGPLGNADEAHISLRKAVR
jgi:hypothetical protein